MFSYPLIRDDLSSTPSIDDHTRCLTFPIKRSRWTPHHQMLGFFLRRLYLPLGLAFAECPEQELLHGTHNGPLSNALQLQQDNIKVSNAVSFPFTAGAQIDLQSQHLCRTKTKDN